MAYVLKSKHGIPLKTGGKSKGGLLRMPGGRVPVYDKKSTAIKVRRIIANRAYRDPIRRKKVINAIIIKKI